MQVVWKGGSWAARHTMRAHRLPRPWLGSAGEELSLFCQKPVAGRVARGVKLRLSPLSARQPAEVPRFASHVLARTRQGRTKPVPTATTRTGWVPSPTHRTPRCVVGGKTAGVGFFLPQTSQGADGGENPFSQFLLD